MSITLVNIAGPNMDAGEKAKKDITKFLSAKGIKTVNIPVMITPEHHGWKGKVRKLWAAKVVIPREIKKLQAEDVIILQYPIIYSMFIIETVIKELQKYTHAKLVFIIHDLESLRQTFNGHRYEYFDREISILKQADGIIAHNEQMKTWLRSQGINRPIVNLQLFDYDNPQPIVGQPKDFRTVAFAGNLKKSLFLTRFSPQHSVFLYGMNPDKYAGNIKYCGQYSPEELPAYLTQGFGLVWDGPQVDTCAGALGNYVRFNNPHKVSLYLSTGLPVIIWKQAALAPFIRKNNIGITVDHLAEIDDILDEMSLEEYQAMRGNVGRLARRIRSGAFISQALNAIFDQIGYSGN